MKDHKLFADMDVADDGRGGTSGRESCGEPPRLRRADRSQVLMLTCELDALLPADHRARMIAAAIERLDLSLFYDSIRARGAIPGRAATDPKLLLGLWLYATADGVGCGRRIARLCECHDAYRWLCGGVSINYHTLNDFRVEHDAALDALFTSLLTTLVDKGVISVECISQDGTRVRASAGSSSFRSGQRLRELHDTMAQHVQEVKRQMDPTVSAQQQRARERAAVEKLQRLEQALDELPEVEAARARWTRGKQRETAARASTTDPEARVMKIGNQGYAPAYNVQIGTDTKSRAIVGIDVTNEGSDVHQSAPMRQQIERRMAAAEATLGRSVPRMKEHLLDGGYADATEVRNAEEEGVTMYVPPRTRTVKDGDDPTTGVRASDPDHIKRWHEWMSTPKAQEYKTLRGSTVETINADLKTHRSMDKFVVRGLRKVRCVALLNALTYNLLLFGHVINST